MHDFMFSRRRVRRLTVLWGVKKTTFAKNVIIVLSYYTIVTILLSYTQFSIPS
jgi:hypothetical protein